jgi:hypothetical protein
MVNYFLILNQIEMKKNMGSADTIIRLVIAAIITVLYITHTISGTLGLVLIVLSGIFVITSVFSFCPLYLPFGINTGKKKSK